MSVELKTTVTELMEDDDSFHVVWLTLMNEIQVQTIERIESIKRQIKDRKPQQFTGQDLEKTAVANRADALELTNAGQYEHNLSLDMLKNYLLGGGADNKDLRFPFCLLKMKLDEALIQIGYMDKATADAHMMKEKLHYKDINSGATKTYRKQSDLGQCPPANNASDSKPPSGFRANLAQTEGWCGTQAEALALIQENAAPAKVWGGTQAEVMALIQHEQQNGTKTGLCHNCNKPATGPASVLRRRGTAETLPPTGRRWPQQLERLPPSPFMGRHSTGVPSVTDGLPPMIPLATPTAAERRKPTLVKPARVWNSKIHRHGMLIPTAL
jgi:hypothetical protein